MTQSVSLNFSRPLAGPQFSSTILLVEDSKPLRDVMEETLKEKGHTVTAVGSQAEALAVDNDATNPFDRIVSALSLGPEGYIGDQLLMTLGERFGLSPEKLLLYTASGMRQSNGRYTVVDKNDRTKLLSLLA